MSANMPSDILSRLRAMGPYLAVELILPGGTLIALLLWLSQRFGRARFGPMHAYVSARLLGRPAIAARPHDFGDDACMAWAPCTRQGELLLVA